MLKIKLVKCRNKYTFNVKILDSRKTHSKKSIKLGWIDRKYKKGYIMYSEIIRNISNGVWISKGIKKLLKLIKNINSGYDLQIS